MPNAKQHALIGVGVGLAGYALYCRCSNRQFDLGEAVLATGVCVLGSMCPDGLEPAIHSWHRGIGHSVAAGGLSANAAAPLFVGGDASFESLLLCFFALGYLSHLAADGCTPRSLPLLGLRA